MTGLAMTLTGVGWRAGGRDIIRDIDLDVRPGEFLALLGPNGSGKSSLLRCAYRFLRPDTGRIALDGQDVWRARPRWVAQRLAVVTQDLPAEFDFTVAEIVEMGRTPHLGTTARSGDTDRDTVGNAMEQAGVSALAYRTLGTLSGGERQRVLLARALAQQPQVMILDEPTNHLDVRHQFALLDLVSTLGVTVVAALHDLDLAAAYADRIAVLQGGRLVAAGTPPEVLTADLIDRVYGVSADVTHDTDGRIAVRLRPARRTEVNAR